MPGIGSLNQGGDGTCPQKERPKRKHVSRYKQSSAGTASPVGVCGQPKTRLPAAGFAFVLQEETGPGDLLQGAVKRNCDERRRGRQDLTVTVHWEENLETESEESQHGRDTLTAVSPQNMLRGRARGAEGKPGGAVDWKGRERRTYFSQQGAGQQLCINGKSTRPVRTGTRREREGAGIPCALS